VFASKEEGFETPLESSNEKEKSQKYIQIKVLKNSLMEKGTCPGAPWRL